MEALPTTMTISSALTSSTNHHQSQSGSRIQSVSVLAVVPTLSGQLPSEAGATVYVAGSGTPKSDSPIAWSTVIPKVQSTNGGGANLTIDRSLSSSLSDTQHQLSLQQQQQQPAHVVKIQINPALDNTRVISTVHLAPDQIDPRDNNSEIDECYLNKKDNIEQFSATNIVNGSVNNIDSCIRISLTNEADHQLVNQQIATQQQQQHQRDEMVQRGPTECVNNTPTNRSSTCFYYGPFPNSISTMSSGQCSPSDTLDSGTCSDLDGTPPPLPKKKNANTVMLSITTGQHNRTGSLTSSGAEVDSDDNESSISCDSLNSGELAARIAEQMLTSGIDVSSDKSRDLSTNDMSTVMMKDNNVHIHNVKIDSVEPDDERVNLSSNINKNMKNNDSNNSNNNNINNKYNNHNDNNDVNIDEINENGSGKSSSCLPDAVSSGQNSLSVSPSPSSTSSLSKSSSTPRVRSPNPLVNGHCLQSTSPVVKECTYEDRKREQERLEQESATAEHYANYNRDNGTKYVYEDDRFYKFHINELEPDNDVDDDDNDTNDNNNIDKKKKFVDNETEEYFAGYKILDKEAIRSAKGTVRGVKNRVRAGIATFLQNPSSKNYKQKDAGKVVVYTTSMRVVTKTMIACAKMRQILNTHMVQYEERDLFGSREFQAELKERLGIDLIEVPQLFIDGQHMGDADAVERLNESEELRPMLKPYKYRGVRKVCPVCGGANAIPCISCHGSKKSWRWNGFLNEVFALRCMNCDEVGLIRCPSC